MDMVQDDDYAPVEATAEETAVDMPCHLVVQTRAVWDEEFGNDDLRQFVADTFARTFDDQLGLPCWARGCTVERVLGTRKWVVCYETPRSAGYCAARWRVALRSVREQYLDR